MAVTLSATKQQNIAVNKARHLIFFEGSDVCYNYKTQQWTAVPAYTGLGMYTINSKAGDIGLVVFNAGSVDMQFQSVNSAAQDAKITTGAVDINQGGRVVVNGFRPLVNGGTYSVRIGVQDDVGDSVTWSSATAVNSRTNMANFRSEGRYVRGELTITGGFTTAIGADIEFTPQGKV